MTSSLLFLAGLFLLLLVNMAFQQPPPPYYPMERPYYPPVGYPERPVSPLLTNLSALITSLLFTLLFWMIITQSDPFEQRKTGPERMERDSSAPPPLPVKKILPMEA